MESELKDLRIDRTKRRRDEPSPWAVRWIIGGVLLFVLLGTARLIYGRLDAPAEVEVVRARSAAAIPASRAPATLPWPR